MFGNQRIRLAAAGDRQLAVVAEDGAVYTCGHGGYGQLGLGDGQPRRRLTRVPQALFAGSASSCVPNPARHGREPSADVRVSARCPDTPAARRGFASCSRSSGRSLRSGAASPSAAPRSELTTVTRTHFVGLPNRSHFVGPIKFTVQIN